MAQAEIITLNSRVGKTIELRSHVGKEILLNSRILNDVLIPPSGTLTLNNIVTPEPPGEVLFDFTTSDLDGTVTKIELLRKESLEPSFSETGVEILTPGATGQITDTAVPTGTFEYKLLITDNDGVTAESNVVAGIVIGTLIVTFDVPPDGVIANGAGVPGFASIIKGYSTGANGEVRQISGIGRTTALAEADGAFFTLEDDLNQINGDGTWEVTQKIKVTSISGRYRSFIRGSKTTSKFVLWPSDVILAIEMLADLRGAFFFRNTSGSFVTFSIFSGAFAVGVETTMGIKKDATNYTFTLGAVSTSLAIASVQAETNNFYTVGAFATSSNIHIGESDDILRQ